MDHPWVGGDWVAGGSVANLLVLWRLHELGPAMRAAWQADVVLMGRDPLADPPAVVLTGAARRRLRTGDVRRVGDLGLEDFADDGHQADFVLSEPPVAHFQGVEPCESVQGIR